jgi:hypothetical protein
MITEATNDEGRSKDYVKQGGTFKKPLRGLREIALHNNFLGITSGLSRTGRAGDG